MGHHKPAPAWEGWDHYVEVLREIHGRLGLLLETVNEQALPDHAASSHAGRLSVILAGLGDVIEDAAETAKDEKALPSAASAKRRKSKGSSDRKS